MPSLSQFGINITVKELRVGLLICFLGGITTLIGVYLHRKKREVFQLKSEGFEKEKPSQTEREEVINSTQLASRLHQKIHEIRSSQPKSKKQIIDRSKNRLNERIEDIDAPDLS